MSPLTEEEYNADLARELGYPLVIVSANELGTINATLQTLITANACCIGLGVAGVVLNSARSHEDDQSVDSNAGELARRGAVRLLAVVKQGGGFDREVDWWALAKSEQPGAARDARRARSTGSGVRGRQ
jgi:dethiobiotin synthetase